MMKKTDLRIVKTHRNIRQALIELLQHKSYDEIVVQDILDVGLINRSTFYAHYTGLDDLVGQMIADFKDFYAQEVEKLIVAINMDAFFQASQPKLFDRRAEMLALQSIQTKRHHLQQDQIEIIKTNILQHAQDKLNAEHLDYQAEIFAQMVVMTERYYLSRQQAIPTDKIAELLLGVVGLVR